MLTKLKFALGLAFGNVLEVTGLALSIKSRSVSRGKGNMVSGELPYQEGILKTAKGELDVLQTIKRRRQFSPASNAQNVQAF